MQIRGKVKHVSVITVLLALILAFPVSAYAETALVLNFDGKTLQWSEGVSVDENGTANIDLFETSYINTNSENGGNVIAPGTDGSTEVTIANSSSKELTYKAVLYTTDYVDAAEVSFSSDTGISFADGASLLPEDVRENAVIIGAYTGIVTGYSESSLVIDWSWVYETGNDETDTALGDIGADELNVHLYIYGEAPDDVYPVQPQTGDDSPFGVMLGACAAALILLAAIMCVKRKRGNQRYE